jgi:phosphoribosylaminoimidazole-succinocarboxamide synthase
VNQQSLYTSTGKGLRLQRRGKVRDVYAPDDEHLLIVACDRISAFDHVLPDAVPGKGKILTKMSNFWFEKTAHIVPNHLVAAEPDHHYPELGWFDESLSGRTVLVRKTEPLPIEVIIRGYITGSGWKEYCQTGEVCGIRLPEGLVEAQKLPQPIFTPSTKADDGHDQNISFAEASAMVGENIAMLVQQIGLDLYRYAVGYALECGIIIADTKFEFGLSDDGQLLLIDELLTPDSSRFWPVEGYQAGRPQPSFDKQYVRDYLDSIGWDKPPPAPGLPAEIIGKTQEKYAEALGRLMT